MPRLANGPAGSNSFISGPVMNDTQANFAVNPRRLTPPLWWWVILALAVVAGTVLMLADVPIDPAFINLICISLGILVALILLAWFTFLSGFRWSVRGLSLLLLLAALA